MAREVIEAMGPGDFGAVPSLLTLTVDVEDHRSASNGARHCERATRNILDFLSAAGTTGTFFVVGELARHAPGLVREIANGGHEVACHGYRHLPLTQLKPSTLRRELALARATLEDLAGVPVRGFRAPLFSLTAATAWAADAIAEAGFAYSSSVLPARSFAFGFPGAPPVPFRWPGGLLELPCPLGQAGLFRLPCLGGMYLRYLPPWRLRQLARNLSTDFVWIYCHPYDFATGEAFGRVPDRGVLASLFLWCNRGATLGRMSALMHGRRSVPFAQRLAGLDPPTFVPPQSRRPV